MENTEIKGEPWRILTDSKLTRNKKKKIASRKQ